MRDQTHVVLPGPRIQVASACTHKHSAAQLSPKQVCLIAEFKKAQHEGLTALNAHVADVTGGRYAVSDESEYPQACCYRRGYSKLW